MNYLPHFADPRPMNFAFFYIWAPTGLISFFLLRFDGPLGAITRSVFISAISVPSGTSFTLTWPVASPLESSPSYQSLDRPESSLSFGCLPQLSRSGQKDSSAWTSQLGTILSETSGQKIWMISFIAWNNSLISRCALVQSLRWLISIRLLALAVRYSSVQQALGRTILASSGLSPAVSSFL